MTELAEVLDGTRRWCVVHGEAADVLASLPDDCVDVWMSDPPYARRVHENARTSRRTTLPDVAKFTCRTNRRLDLRFEHLTPGLRRLLAHQAARLARRWVLNFCDTESTWLWRISCEAAGLKYIRTCEWDRMGSGAPQFTGTEPAVASESIVCCHRPGRRHWNGGGKAGRYPFPIVANRLGQRHSRVHDSQKPDGLMVALVEDFSDPDELILDATCGSATTGVAAIRRGRRFIGIERDATWSAVARERLEAETCGQSLLSYRRGQRSLFG